MKQASYSVMYYRSAFCAPMITCREINWSLNETAASLSYTEFYKLNREHHWFLDSEAKILVVFVAYVPPSGQKVCIVSSKLASRYSYKSLDIWDKTAVIFCLGLVIISALYFLKITVYYFSIFFYGLIRFSASLDNTFLSFGTNLVWKI